MLTDMLNSLPVFLHAIHIHRMVVRVGSMMVMIASIMKANVVFG